MLKRFGAIDAKIVDNNMVKNEEWLVISGPAGGNIDWDLGTP